MLLRLARWQLSIAMMATLGDSLGDLLAIYWRFLSVGWEGYRQGLVRRELREVTGSMVVTFRVNVGATQQVTPEVTPEVIPEVAWLLEACGGRCAGVRCGRMA